ncbi:N-acetyltransferase family protein [Vibrio alginolyticus]|uniref:GNAT family N-acetyltransferase n=1 Tax=Vibrio sp. B1FLJ16 TaxID=2751178 RepID=UPI0015F6D86A|nr:GNAT family N-acetyltransferase [Vibrio sp. B1FLJ16]CAD7817937.1 Acetyltransferase (GNAT) domain [Vibrio sp. B1FLJ16]CAD7818983.1 Acetyltransferase (GNAT) domain [Vibrio sp. B1FLJ16]CAE6932756.1 Acetyltransferase (GNAT) domain [Vibrio sp. B1FLJ16]CAE6936909.1 Acetyltransferase (GNAT) domain [Vibrio sp. B1FLJ16]
MEIKEVNSVSGVLVQLHDLLNDCVESGASVGFLTPVDGSEIEAYWQSVESDLQAGSRKLFLAYDNNTVVGAVQLSLCSKANGSHRGEVEKLMVKTSARGKGVSKKLMSLMESTAAEIGLSLLVLDTRLGDIASTLYRSIGYTEAGQIPQFARSSSGELEATVYFFKLLSE